MRVKNPELKRKMRKLKARKPSWGVEMREAIIAKNLFKKAHVSNFEAILRNR